MSLTVVEKKLISVKSLKKPIVSERFHLDADFKLNLMARPTNWGFGQFSEAVYYRTYSRIKPNGAQETWADTVIRVVEGVMSIRKDWYMNVLGKTWSDTKYQQIAQRLANFIFDMKILPPGRGLWAMGTEYVYDRGCAAVNNCGAVVVGDDLADSAAWLMDSLMCGIGVGFTTHTATFGAFTNPLETEVTYIVPDSREGWVESLKILINSYVKNSKPTARFDYSEIRPVGAPLRGFGGTSAGYAPLEKLHERVRGYLDSYVRGDTFRVRLIMDIMNAIGACVVAGNVRRSAELAIGAPGDEEFINMKNYELNPERAEIGWMSNNSIALTEREHFDYLPNIAERIRDNGEPGILNFINVQKYGRIGERMEDNAVAFNPCAEIALADRELCNLSEVFPTRCSSTEEIYEAMELATFYSSTVALLRSHDESTNQILSQNRRIGVSISGVADWIDGTSVSHVFGVLNNGYERVVRPTNKKLAKEAGVPESIRVTTIKPSGSISAVAGVSSGMHHPFDRYVIRRMRVAENSPVTEILKNANIPHEKDVYSDNTMVFEFPLRYGRGKTRSIKNVSIYEQAAIVAMLQKAWVDNAVSNTLTVQPKELDQIERVLALFAPQTKSLSLLPDIEEGAYAQMPLEKISKDEFERRAAEVKDIDWSALTGQDGEDQRFCTNDACEI